MKTAFERRFAIAGTLEDHERPTYHNELEERDFPDD